MQTEGITVTQMNEVIPPVHIKYHDDKYPDLVRLNQTENGDWIDLRAAETYMIKAGESACIKLGISMALPEGYEAYVLPRSSTYKNWHILETNSMGVIDNSYRGDGDEWGMLVYATHDCVIPKNSRVCQFRIQKKMPRITFIEVDSLGNADRGGFGSTGTK